MNIFRLIFDDYNTIVIFHVYLKNLYLKASEYHKILIHFQCSYVTKRKIKYFPKIQLEYYIAIDSNRGLNN